MIPKRLLNLMKENYLNPLEFQGENATASAFDAANVLNVEVGQIAKSILFKDKFSKYTMILASGDRKLQNIKIKELIGSRVSMASFDETLEITGYPIGGVCPYDLDIKKVSVFIDSSLKAYETVYTACGSKNSLVAINYNTLIKLSNAKTCNVT